ncbi:hypothetical protein ABZ403_10440 [Micromonospora zamorensis]|uniref:hypothetical protein n=1 Tax=Micromonospora zamorensis TaxID=709883 RepID=UPI0033D45523
MRTRPRGSSSTRHSPWTLYWWQFRSHLAPRSVHLHSSIRLAVALALARVAAGVLRRNPPGCLAGWPAAAVLLRDSAGHLRSAYEALADEVAHGRPAGPTRLPTGCAAELDRIRPALGEADPRSVRHLVEVDRWLAGLADTLARIHPPAQGDSAGRRGQP